MEFDCIKREICIRYFDGPYNDQIITRRFHIDGPKRGVAGDALNTGEVQVKIQMGKGKGDVLYIPIFAIGSEL